MRAATTARARANERARANPHTSRSLAHDRERTIPVRPRVTD